MRKKTETFIEFYKFFVTETMKQEEERTRKENEIDIVADGITDITDLIHSGKIIYVRPGYYCLTNKNGRIFVTPDLEKEGKS